MCRFNGTMWASSPTMVVCSFGCIPFGKRDDVGIVPYDGCLFVRVYTVRRTGRCGHRPLHFLFISNNFRFTIIFVVGGDAHIAPPQTNHRTLPHYFHSSINFCEYNLYATARDTDFNNGSNPSRRGIFLSPKTDAHAHSAAPQKSS